ncbi:MAG: hypothetical protein ACYC7E_12780 [Armatimonadota bacterium]
MQTVQRQQGSRMAPPWYSLDPRSIRASHVLLPILIFFLLVMFSEKHVWQWNWTSGLHAAFNCRHVTGVDGQRYDAWRWVEGREIRVYVTGDKSRKACRTLAYAMQQVSDELGLTLQVSTLPASPRITAALAHSTKIVQGKRQLNFTTLCRELVSTRQGEYAEVVFTPDTIGAGADVVGSALFTYGVAVLDARRATVSTARHEMGHLLGYHLHDTLPFAVFGYPIYFTHLQHNQRSPRPLMTSWDDGYALSARSRDALVCFWRGLEQRTTRRYFIPASLTLAKSRAASIFHQRPD